MAFRVEFRKRFSKDHMYASITSELEAQRVYNDFKKFARSAGGLWDGSLASDETMNLLRKELIQKKVE